MKVKVDNSENFQKDLKRGKAGEYKLGKLLEKEGNSVEYAPDGYFKPYDLKITTKENRTYSIEVKTDETESANVFIEFLSRGNESGIYSTQADFYAVYNIQAGRVWFSPPDRLIRIHKNETYERIVKNKVNNGETFGFLLTKEFMNKVFKYKSL